MELEITKFFNAAKPRNYSASVAELGRDAGAITWANACEDAPAFDLLNSDEKREAARAFVRTLGAWSDDEIAAWSDTELAALIMQFIAGDMREFFELAHGDWSEWEALCNAGTCSSRIFGGPLSVDGRVYFQMD